MTTIARFLFPAPAERSPAAIFRWWEARRLAYNGVMAASGFLCLGAMALVANLPPGSTELPPLPLILVYGGMANLFYSLGPLAECALEMIWPRKVLPTGPALYRMGLTFSLGLNFLAVMMMGWDWVVRVLKWLL